jgi:chromosomal replication initiation ATPase DnaA
MNPYIAPGIHFEPMQIVRVWEEHYEMTLENIIPYNKHTKIKIPRQVLMYLLKTFGGLSFQKVGEVVYRSHADVMHGCKVVNETYLQDKELREGIEEIIEKFRELKSVDSQFISVKLGRSDLLRLLPDLTE